MSNKIHNQYCNDFFNRTRFVTKEVQIGNVRLGGNNPVVVQSMTTSDTMDTQKSVEESMRMIDAGCQIVRLTAPSIKDAKNLKIIKEKLVEKGYETPLVADIHFTPNAAHEAAQHVEKIRINPGNFADKKKFEEIEYTDESYADELKRIEEKFTPLVVECKTLGRVIRIGTNHGSLSDRILSRYGDTPEGMVESAMEFLRICQKNDFHNIVFSMKASNTLVMVQAYRLLTATLKKDELCYPLHLGVTEAGDGEDGRIKSAVGIGALLEDGIGDTIRVSLTESAEAEIPVAKKLLRKYEKMSPTLHENRSIDFDPFSYNKRNVSEVLNVGNHHVPVVIGDLSNVEKITQASLFAFGYHYSVPLDKWNIQDLAVDYIYIGNKTVDFEIPGTLRLISDYSTWSKNYTQNDTFVPLIQLDEIDKIDKNTAAFLTVDPSNPDVQFLQNYPNLILIAEYNHGNYTQLIRQFRLNLAELNVINPVILHYQSEEKDAETFQLWSSASLGCSLIDGFGEGVFLQSNLNNQLLISTSFGILQATRTRISKTEYISCPSCGRTLFDLQETTAKIRSKTSHLKGIKIGIMGCIVNGPGEMADADYGYVGTGPGKIHLYKEKEVVRKNIAEAEAVDALIELIKEHGDWIDPKSY